MKDGYRGPKGDTTLSINTSLRNLRDQMDTVFKFYEAMDKIPTAAEIQKKYEERLKGVIPQRPAQEQKPRRKPKEPNLFDVFDEFTRKCGEKNAWTDATFDKMSAIRNDVYNFDSKARLSALDEDWLTAFVGYLRDEKIIYASKKKDDAEKEKEIRKGLCNSTIKTADSVSIEPNDITKAILDKYKDAHFTGDKVLPPYTNQAMNQSLKELCRLAGIDEPVRITTYKGNVRSDEIYPKWALIGTHTGRRTFIVHALSMGISPNIVMKWTGHSDFKAMKPYIDIVDSIKASSMTKFDGSL